MSWKPLNPQTHGFLGLLGLKNMGRSPDALLEEVRPTVNMEPWYLRGNALLAWRTGAVPTADYSGFFAPDLNQFAVALGVLTVPAGEMWYVHECQSWVVTGVTDLTALNGVSSAAQVPLGGGTTHIIIDGIGWYSVAPDAPAQLLPAAFPLQDKWVPAGTQFGVWIGDIDSQNGGAPVAFSITTSLRYTPIKI